MIENPFKTAPFYYFYTSINFVLGKIHLHDIRLYAHHGCLAEETIIGSDYLVQLSVEGNLTRSSVSDDLSHTIDYVTLQSIVKQEMSVPSRLLEHVGQRIIDKVLNTLLLVDKVCVTITKCNPPIGGDVAGVSVVIEQAR